MICGHTPPRACSIGVIEKNHTVSGRSKQHTRARDHSPVVSRYQYSSCSLENPSRSQRNRPCRTQRMVDSARCTVCSGVYQFSKESKHVSPQTSQDCQILDNLSLQNTVTVGSGLGELSQKRRCGPGKPLKCFALWLVLGSL